MLLGILEVQGSKLGVMARYPDRDLSWVSSASVLLHRQQPLLSIFIPILLFMNHHIIQRLSDLLAATLNNPEINK
jgi:hypothetical protein